MLYVTTRNKTDAHTAHKTLQTDRGPDGGLYIPYRLPRLSEDQISSLKDKSFGQCVADILNLFFSAKLDALDVDFCVGRYPARLVSMSHRIVIAETWHNPDWDFARMVRNLTGRIRATEDSSGSFGNWAWIAIRIAALFALYGDLLRNNLAAPGQKLDIAVTAGDFSAPMSAWYAREMGLPIGTIICGCDDNSAAWDLLHHGQLSTNAAESVPSDLERLVFATLGWEETRRYCEVCQCGGIYTPGEEQLETLRSGLFAAVVSSKRTESVIRNVYRTNTYLLGPESAIAYGGLQDYRASTGEAGPALILTERSPICSADAVAKAMGITVRELQDRIGLT